MNGKKIIIYTDLDGTLLDHETYSFAESLPTLSAAQAFGIPIIFCSSKTRAEIEHLRQRMGVHDPFIIENGGAVVIPPGYFPLSSCSKAGDGDATLALGTPYQRLVENLRELRTEFPSQLIGFSDLSAEEVASDCGLTLDEALRAKRREFDEPFRLLSSNAEEVSRLMEAIRERGLFCSQGGRYYHLHGHNDKGAAVNLLNHLFEQTGEQIFTVAIGDGLNDLPMLALVDYPVLVKKPDGSYDDPVIKLLPQTIRAEGIGPLGWRDAVTKILRNSLKRDLANSGVAAR